MQVKVDSAGNQFEKCPIKVFGLYQKVTKKGKREAEIRIADLSVGNYYLVLFKEGYKVGNGTFVRR